MKKILITLGLVITTITSYAQSTILSRDNTFLRGKTESTGDVSFGFQNMEYQHITDIGLVRMSKTQAINLMNKVVKTMGSGSTEVVWIEGSNYEVLWMPEYPNSVTLYSGKKFTQLNKTEVKTIQTRLNQ